MGPVMLWCTLTFDLVPSTVFFSFHTPFVLAELPILLECSCIGSDGVSQPCEKVSLEMIMERSFTYALINTIFQPFKWKSAALSSFI